MSNSEKFDELFKKFDFETQKKARNLRIKFSCNNDEKNGYIGLKQCINELYRFRYNPYYKDYDFIDFCIQIRNIKFHRNDDNYFFLTDDTIEKFKEVLKKVEHPDNVLAKATKNVYSANLSSNVKEVMNEMNINSYTHIPIYDENNKKLVGIFSEFSLYDYINKNGVILIEDDTTFQQIEDCIKIENSNERVIFKSKTDLYDDTVNDFIKQYKNKNKLDCIMITDSGSADEKVIGILTIWDVIGRE